MIALKREVAGCQRWHTGFPWSECQVTKTDDKSLYKVCIRQKRRERAEDLKNVA